MEQEVVCTDCCWLISDLVIDATPRYRTICNTNNTEQEFVIMILLIMYNISEQICNYIVNIFIKNKCY